MAEHQGQQRTVPQNGKVPLPRRAAGHAGSFSPRSLYYRSGSQYQNSRCRQRTVTATTSKGAEAKRTIEIVPPAKTKTLLAGDGTATYSVGDQTTTGREEAFQFTAKASGTVEELQFRTNGTANTGVTGVSLGVFADNAGKPGAVLGQAKVSGEPSVSSWVKATGVAISLVSGTKYWLVALPAGSGRLHFNAAAGVGAGTGNVESTAGALTTLTAQSSWESYNQGPIGFQALGTTGAPPPPSVTIEGAPASMTAGSSVQLSAHVTTVRRIAAISSKWSMPPRKASLSI